LSRGLKDIFKGIDQYIWHLTGKNDNSLSNREVSF